MQGYETYITQIDGLRVIWSSSASNCDLEGESPVIRNAQVGHLHIHTNVNAGRIQVWVLERKAWEEHAVNIDRRNELVVGNIVRDSYWLALVRNAQVMHTLRGEI